jgi:hypothetical protein
MRLQAAWFAYFFCPKCTESINCPMVGMSGWIRDFGKINTPLLGRR